MKYEKEQTECGDWAVFLTTPGRDHRFYYPTEAEAEEARQHWERIASNPTGRVVHLDFETRSSAELRHEYDPYSIVLTDGMDFAEMEMRVLAAMAAHPPVDIKARCCGKTEITERRLAVLVSKTLKPLPAPREYLKHDPTKSARRRGRK